MKNKLISFLLVFIVGLCVSAFIISMLCLYYHVGVNDLLGSNYKYFIPIPAIIIAVFFSNYLVYNIFHFSFKKATLYLLLLTFTIVSIAIGSKYRYNYFLWEKPINLKILMTDSIYSVNKVVCDSSIIIPTNDTLNNWELDHVPLFRNNRLNYCSVFQKIKSISKQKRTHIKYNLYESAKVLNFAKKLEGYAVYSQSKKSLNSSILLYETNFDDKDLDRKKVHFLRFENKKLVEYYNYNVDEDDINYRSFGSLFLLLSLFVSLALLFKLVFALIKKL